MYVCMHVSSHLSQTWSVALFKFLFIKNNQKFSKKARKMEEGRVFPILPVENIKEWKGEIFLLGGPKEGLRRGRGNDESVLKNFVRMLIKHIITIKSITNKTTQSKNTNYGKWELATFYSREKNGMGIICRYFSRSQLTFVFEFWVALIFIYKSF